MEGAARSLQAPRPEARGPWLEDIVGGVESHSLEAHFLLYVLKCKFEVCARLDST